MTEKSVEHPKVFISYSWAVQELVIELAQQLRAHGVDVCLDVWDLKDGHDKYAFMEQSVNDESISKVLIICDKTYQEKADGRIGGVGDETVIITPAIYGRIKQEKFIPVVFEFDADGNACVPAYLKSRIYINLAPDNENRESEYEKLLRDIFDKPLHKKTALGKKPEWLENENVNFSAIRGLFKQIMRQDARASSNLEFLLRSVADEFVAIAKQYTLPYDKPKDEGLLIAIEQSKDVRDLFIEYCDVLLRGGIQLGLTLSSLIEQLYNTLTDASMDGSFEPYVFDLYYFMTWELFIVTTAFLLHHKKYDELNKMLCKTYWLRADPYNVDLTPHNYFAIRRSMRALESSCKIKYTNPKVFTVAGDILVHREKGNILTKKALVEADLVLFQFGRTKLVPMATVDSDWVPMTYVYDNRYGKQMLWAKMCSRAYCKEIAHLFGVQTYEQIQEVIAFPRNKSEMRFPQAFESARLITDSIALKDIGTLN